MSSLNKVMLIGRLGADPEIRRTQAGDRVCSFRLATSESWRDKQTGERRERTEWHNVVIMGNDALCDVSERYLQKGDQILIEGQLRTRKWQQQDGADRWTTEVVLGAFNAQLRILRAKKWEEGGSSGENSPSEPVAPRRPPVEGEHSGTRFDDDEIPF